MPLIMIKSDARAREKPCLRCGYSLRKSLDSKYCPECGLSVWLSLNSNDTLDWSNPDWLRRLSLASLALAAAQVFGLIPYTCWALAELVDVRWIIAAVLTGALYLVAYNFGLMLLGQYEGRHPDRWKTYRWSCRGAAGFGLLVGAILMTGGMRAISGFVVPTVVKASVMASSIATWAYFRKLAQRLPRSSLARISGYLMFLPILPLLALLKFVPFFAIFAVFEIWGLLDFLPIAYLPVTIVLFVWFARLFAKAAKSAEQGWASETGT
jgi:hypothetical protein